MSHFSLFDLPVSVSIDSADLHSRYIRLQQAAHPDRFAGGSEAEKLRAMQMSSQINDAFQVLSNTVSRLRHLLEIVGVDIDDAKTNQDMMFLMQQMEIRESLDAAIANADTEKLVALEQQNKQSSDAVVEQFSTRYTEQQFDDCLVLIQKIQFFDKFQQELTRTQKRLARAK